MGDGRAAPWLLSLPGESQEGRMPRALDADDRGLRLTRDDRRSSEGLIAKMEERLRRNAGVREVVEMHARGDSFGSVPMCHGCQQQYPCPTIRALADAYAPAGSDV